MSTTTVTTIPVATSRGSVDVELHWQGAALAVHKPVLKDGIKPKRGHWSITHIASGHSVGTFEGPARSAVKLASLWDHAFSELDPQVSRSWPLARQWVAQLRKQQPIAGPDPALAAPPTKPENDGLPASIHLAKSARRRYRQDEHGTWQIQWRGTWWNAPTDPELDFWTIDSICESPDGRSLEPDHPESWLSILRLV